MKFLTDEDAKLFLAEIGQLKLIESANKDLVPTEEMLEIYVGRREGLVKKLKDHRRGQNAKAQWRESRHKMMRGIKAYHRSTEGKRFHRNLGNHLANRIFKHESFANIIEKSEYLKALSSAKTHFFIELQYYHTLSEQLELEELVFDYSTQMFNSIENKIINDQDLDENEETFLFDITEVASVVKSLAQKAGVSPQQVEDKWNSIKKGLISSGLKETEDKFYPILVSTLKKSLNLT